MLQELGRETGIGPEQQRLLAADDPRVEMGNRHRRRARGGLAINLCVVLVADSVDVAAQPDAAHREAAVPLCLGNMRLLQQREGAAARPDEDELGRYGGDTTVIRVL